MDNHCSHVSLQVVNAARENGAVIVALPPHTSHQLQPLDRTAFGPMKGSFKKAMKDWLKSNPGQTISIYKLSTLTGQVFNMAMTPSHSLSPLNPDILTEQDFLPSDVPSTQYVSKVLQ